MIEAGKLRHRVTIQAPPTTRNTRGRVERSDAWSDVDSRSAEIISLRGNELERARQQVATATHKVSMRKPRAFDLTTKHRIEFKGRFFNVGFVPDIGELGALVELICSEDRL